MGLFFFVGQRVKLGRFDRKEAVSVQPLQTQITEIGQHPRVWVNVGAGVFEKLEVMSAAFAEACRDDLLCFPVEQYLRLQGVPLFLPAIAPSLLFFGLSTGVSVASTTINDMSTPSSERAARLLGRLNLPEVIRAASTLRMMR